MTRRTSAVAPSERITQLGPSRDARKPGDRLQRAQDALGHAITEVRPSAASASEREHAAVKTQDPCLLGLPISAMTEGELLGAVTSAVESGAPTVFVGVYASLFRRISRDADYRELVSRSVTYPDGHGVVSELHKRGFAKAERLATTDIVHPISRLAAQRAWRVGLYGAAPGVAERAAAALSQSAPGVEIVAVWDGFSEGPSVAALKHARLDVLFVGLGAGVQEAWAYDTAVPAGVPAILTCGGLFDFLSADKKRAPRWMQRVGLEWLFRVMLEPRRLFSRYLLGNGYFLRHARADRSNPAGAVGAAPHQAAYQLAQQPESPSTSTTGTTPVAGGGSARPRRFSQLDALRGIAALTVVFGHCMRVLPGTGADDTVHSTSLGIMKHTPLHFLWAGHQAVIFFFVLSGFVLSLPFHSARADSYGGFVIKRICRIWLPYVAIISAALMARLLFSRYNDDTFISGWVHSAWLQDLQPLLLLNHASLIGSFNDTLLDPVVWSLTIEMRISIIFPILIWAALRLRWQVTLPGAFLIGAIGYAMTYAGVLANLGRTIAYIPLFVVGILMAKYRENVKRFYHAWASRFGLWSMLLLGVLAYTYPWWVLPHMRRMHIAPPDDWATAIGVVLFITAALGSAAVIKVLSHRIPVWLGRISYSLYLVHAVVLLSLVHLLYGRVPLGVIWLTTVVLSLVLATLSYRYIEVPAMALGKRLTRRARPAAKAPSLVHRIDHEALAKIEKS
jgi:exopolysaccharide biosynthesis WecB/TagA/CpsF family protein